MTKPRRSLPSSFLRVSLVAVFLGVSALGAPWALSDETAEKKVTILYTTDVHGHFTSHVSVPRSKDPDKAPKPKKTGGFAAIGAKVKEIRAESKNPVFLFDSGDIMTGHPICDVEREGVLGGALFWMMNAIGYDAWCIGNHDFDQGRANASKIVDSLKFPTLSANLSVEGEPALKVQRWTILEKGGVKIGVFGLITEGLLEVTVRDKVVGIKPTSAADAAREAVAALTSKCDLIVGLSHCGSDADINLVDKVPGIHVMLSGHNHQRMKAARHGGTIVAEGDIKARHVCRLDLTIKDGKVVEFEDKQIAADAVEPEGELKEAFDWVSKNLGLTLDEVLGKLGEPWKRNYNGESNIGNFFADGLKERAKVDVAFLNSGGIRTNVTGDEVTLGDVYEVFPFGNKIVTFEMTGADLEKTIEKNAKAAAGKEYGILQVAGIRYEFETKGKHAKVVKSSEAGGAPIDPKKVYRCATIDFIAVDQKAKYLGDVTVSKIEKLETTLTKLAEEWVREQGKKGPIKAVVDGRMTETR